MKFYLWMRQSGDGCDYTIGCGNTLHPLEGATIEEARLNVSSDRQLSSALVVSEVEDAMPFVKVKEQQLTERRQEDEQAKKRSELERLKRELGE